MKITKRHPFKGTELTLDLPITEAQLVSFQKGMVAQRAFPHLTADQREFIISGIPPGDFERELALETPATAWMASEYSYELSAEASGLGFPPGEFPELLRIAGRDEVYEKARVNSSSDDETMSVIYHEINGGDRRLVVFND